MPAGEGKVQRPLGKQLSARQVTKGDAGPVSASGAGQAATARTADDASGVVESSPEIENLREQIRVKSEEIVVAGDRLKKAQAANRKLLQRAKELSAAFDDVVKTAAETEKALSDDSKRHGPKDRAEVIRSDIQNLKKLLAIFQRQQKQDQRTVERNRLEVSMSLEKTLSNLQTEEYELEKEYINLEKATENREKAIQQLRSRAQSNHGAQLRQSIRTAKKHLQKRERRAANDDKTTARNRAAMDKATKEHDVLSKLIDEHYLEEDLEMFRAGHKAKASL
ncbi:Uncharacterized protein PBTT_06974 [Plasmodiophora brassicae]